MRLRLHGLEAGRNFRHQRQGKQVLAGALLRPAAGLEPVCTGAGRCDAGGMGGRVDGDLPLDGIRMNGQADGGIQIPADQAQMRPDRGSEAFGPFLAFFLDEQAGVVILRQPGKQGHCGHGKHTSV